MPNSLQTEQMRQEVALQLQRRARSSPHERLGTNVEDVVARAYTDLGEGKFGWLSKTIRIPPDVDTESIKTSFDDDVLQIRLPQQIRRQRTARHPYGIQRSPPFFGHSAFGW